MGPATTPAVVVCDEVAKSYGADLALDGVSLRVSAGEAVAIAGPSGCGKSTLLHILGAMETPDSGRVFFHARDLATMDDREASRFRREEIGFVFQFFNLIPTLNVLDNICLPARLGSRVARADGSEEIRQRARQLLRQVGLANKETAYADALSGGQQQRVAIARALIQEPALVLADEPTGALDRRTGAEVLELLHSLVAQRQAALILATHNEDAMERADRIVRLEDGRILQEGRGPLERGGR